MLQSCSLCVLFCMHHCIIASIRLFVSICVVDIIGKNRHLNLFFSSSSSSSSYSVLLLFRRREDFLTPTNVFVKNIAIASLFMCSVGKNSVLHSTGILFVIFVCENPLILSRDHICALLVFSSIFFKFHEKDIPVKRHHIIWSLEMPYCRVRV